MYTVKWELACGGPQELTHVKEKLHYQEKVTQELHEKFTRYNQPHIICCMYTAKMGTCLRWPTGADAREGEAALSGEGDSGASGEDG
jgi:hypothetical protein